MRELTEFVKEALKAGKSRDEIRSALNQAGWPEEDIQGGLSRFAEVDFPVPIPTRRYSGSPREAFLYLVTFSSLWTAASSFGALLFAYVEHFYPDPTQGIYQSGNDFVRWNVAALVVAFPIYFWLTQLHFREYSRDPERGTSSVRLWLTYITLFVASSVIIGTLVDLVGNVLGGELAVRFFLKVSIVLGIASAILVFYLWEIRWGAKEGKK